MMLLSGRRAVDLLRLKWDCIKYVNRKYCCILPKDKTHQRKLISFSFNLKEWDFDWDLKAFEQWLNSGIDKKRDLVFQEPNFKKKRLTDLCPFRLHACRNFKAIDMLVKGATERQVMNFIGWVSFDSLKTYTKVDVDFIKNFDSYKHFVNFLFEF